MQNPVVETATTFSSPYQIFRYSIRSELTRRYYERRIKRFFDYIDFLSTETLEIRCNSFAEKALIEKNLALDKIVQFLQHQKERVVKDEITAATLSNYVKSIKLFCEMSDIAIPWKKITRGLPRPRESANDRAPTIEEIRNLVQYPDRRIKPIIYVMASSGVRIGAWDYLQWKHVSVYHDDRGEVIAGKLTIYAGEPDQYYSFITTEAYQALTDWMDFRTSYGEVITPDSWLMRDLWQTTNVSSYARLGLATCAKKLKSSGIKRLIERALWEQGIRNTLPKNVRRHEWKAAHGFRKFYKTRAEQTMKPINVEITMGHNIGVSASYYRPTEKEILSDYLKAVDLLTINNNEKKLAKQICELKEKSNDSEYIIKGRLEEKDKQLEYLTKRDFLNSSAIADLSEELIKLKKEIGVLKSSK